MAVNLWPNADLEAGITDWGLSGGSGILSHATARAWEETYSLGVDTEGAAYTGAASTTAVTTGISGSTQYTYSFYVWVVEANVDIRVLAKDQDDNVLGGETASAVAAGQWVRISVSPTTAVDDTGLKFSIYQNATTVDTMFYVDGIMLETGGSASAWVNYASGSAIDLTATIAAVTKVSGPMI